MDEYEWRAGAARDPWRPGLASRVIERPDFRMRSLWFASKDVEGPANVEINGLRNLRFAVAATLVGPGALDSSAITLVPMEPRRCRGPMDCSRGRWRLIAYYVELSQARDGGLVDLMSRDASRPLARRRP